MINDPRIAAMRAATDWAVAKYPADAKSEEAMFDLADRWLAWYDSREIEIPTQPERERLDLAKRALIDTGYFTEDQVSDDIAPRIIEMHSALTRDGSEHQSRSDCQPCGAYLEPDWFRQLPERLRHAYPWLTCANEHSAVNDWHIGAGGVTFATHWCVTAWRDHSSYARCACGEEYGHPGMPMDP